MVRDEVRAAVARVDRGDDRREDVGVQATRDGGVVDAQIVHLDEIGRGDGNLRAVRVPGDVRAHADDAVEVEEVLLEARPAGELQVVEPRHRAPVALVRLAERARGGGGDLAKGAAARADAAMRLGWGEGGRGRGRVRGERRRRRCEEREAASTLEARRGDDDGDDGDDDDDDERFF